MSKVNFGKGHGKEKGNCERPSVVPSLRDVAFFTYFKPKGVSSSTFIVHYFICTVKTDLGFWKFDMDFDIFC